jgi:hypothetical protein
MKHHYMLSVLCIILIFAGCMNPANGKINEIYKYPKDLWGEWVCLETGAVWYIAGNYLTGNTDSNMALKKLSDRVIELTEAGRTYYLYASRIPNGTFTGTVIDNSASALGDTSLSINNFENKSDELIALIGDNGNFTAEGIIPGDKYEITLGKKTTTVTPNTDGENIGTITVTSGANFKTAIVSKISHFVRENDMMRLYSNTNYEFNIVIENTGAVNCAPVYELSPESGLTITNKPSSSMLETIEPGKSRSIPIAVTCGTILNESEYKTIGVTITDTVNQKTWDDSVSLKFHKDKVVFNIKSNGPVSGIIIAPNAKAYAFSALDSNSYSAAITLPRSVTIDYLVVFTGAAADTEAAYSLGIDVPAETSFGGFTQTDNYEPNDTEDTPESLGPNQKITSYIHKKDIDHYKVNLGTP